MIEMATMADGIDGRIAGVRLWNVARNQDEIRRTMNVALIEPLPGLVASWHLNGDYEDKIGGYDGVSVGASFISDSSPAQPAHADVVDANFNTLSATRYAAATAYVPGLDRMFLIGGQRGGGTVVNNVEYLDGATGTEHGGGRRLRAHYRDEALYLFGGTLTFSSKAGSVAVPVTATVTNMPGRGLYLPIIFQ